MIDRPSPEEHHPFYGRYVALVPDGDLLHTLRDQAAATAALLRQSGPAWGDHRYATGKWTVREVVAHLSDTERIFAARALRIARGDRTPLPGFDQDAYVAALDLSARPLTDLADEFGRLRATTVDLFASFTDEALRRVGTVNDGPMSARAAAWIIAGHERHHVEILRQRYAVDADGAPGRT